MKVKCTLVILLINVSLSAQFLNRNKEDTPGHKLFLHGEGDVEIFLWSFGLIAEYTSKNANDQRLLNYSLGFKVRHSLFSLYNVTAVTSEFYYGPQLGLQLGRNRHMLESTINYGYQNINKIFNRPSESEWIYEYRLGYRSQGTRILYRIGIKVQDSAKEGRVGIYMSFGKRLL